MFASLLLGKLFIQVQKQNHYLICLCEQLNTIMVGVAEKTLNRLNFFRVFFKDFAAYSIDQIFTRLYMQFAIAHNATSQQLKNKKKWNWLFLFCRSVVEDRTVENNVVPYKIIWFQVTFPLNSSDREYHRLSQTQVSKVFITFHNNLGKNLTSGHLFVHHNLAKLTSAATTTTTTTTTSPTTTTGIKSVLAKELLKQQKFSLKTNKRI